MPQAIRCRGCAGSGFAEAVHRQARHIDTALHQCAGRHLRRSLRIGPAVSGRGDVQRAQVLPPKADHGGAAHGRVQALQHIALGAQLQHAAAFVHGHPVVAPDVDAGAVGAAAIEPALGLGGEGLPQRARAQRAGFQVEGKAVYAVGWRVCPVHPGVIGTEGQAVGRGAVACHALNGVASGAVRAKAPQRGIGRRLGREQ